MKIKKQYFFFNIYILVLYIKNFFIDVYNKDF